MASIAPTDLRPARPVTGYVLAMAGAVLFASKGIFIKFGYAGGVDAITLLALRMIFAVPFFVAIGIWSRRGATAPAPSFRLWLAAIVTGLLGYWYASYADFKGLETLSPQFERIILFTYPFFVVLLGAAFFNHKLKLKALGAFAVSYCGLAIVFLADFAEDGEAVIAGVFWVLSSAVAFALYQLLARRLIGEFGAPFFTAVAMSAAAAGTLVHFLLTRPVEALFVSPDNLAIAVGLAIFATVMPALFMNFALARISAAANATIGTLSPVVTLILAALILGEIVTLSDVVGTTLVIIGVALFTVIDRRAA